MGVSNTVNMQVSHITVFVFLPLKFFHIWIFLGTVNAEITVNFHLILCSPFMMSSITVCSTVYRIKWFSRKTNAMYTYSFLVVGLPCMPVFEHEDCVSLSLQFPVY